MSGRSVLPSPQPRALREDPEARPVQKSTRMSLDPLAFLDPLTIITAFGLIFLAELPDKTMFASLALGARMRPLYVWFGTSTAFAVHVAIAVGAGGLIGLLPEWTVETVSATLFAFGALMLLRGGGGDGEEDAGGRTVTGFWPVCTTAFMAVFISEWGDLTQIATANLAATKGIASVAIGSTAALMSVSALALLAGRFIAKRVPLRTVRRVGALCMLGLAVRSAVEIFTG